MDGKKFIRCKNNFGEDVELPKEKFFFRPSVYGFILKDDKMVLLQNKSMDKFWFPGGGVEIGETLEEALQREIKEETGLEVRVVKQLFFKENFFYYQPLDEAYQAYLFFFLCELIGDENMTDDDPVLELKTEKPRWVPLSDIPKEKISDLEDDLYPIIMSLKKS